MSHTNELIQTEWPQIKVVTHDGAFHADDAMACAIVNCWTDSLAAYFNRFSYTYLRRSRDESVLADSNIWLDVGARYEPVDNPLEHLKEGKKIYLDHHQRGGAGTRANGVPYATAGLAWKTFGRDTLKMRGISQEVSEKGFQKIDIELMCGIDAADCGLQLIPESVPIKPMSISRMISLLNPRGKDPHLSEPHLSEEYAFRSLAFNFASFTLAGMIREVKHISEGYDLVFKKSQIRQGILVMPEAGSWQEALLSSPEFLGVYFVVFPDDKGIWMAQAVPQKLGSFESRRLLPEPWRGLRDQQLQELIGVPDAVFCHPNGFIGGAKSQESAIQMATLALQS